jgi:dihydrofolate reductase
MSIIARFALSLDGFSADPAGRPAMNGTVGAVAMGRTTFDPAVEDAGWPWPGLDVHVLTSRPLPDREFETDVAVHADPAAMVVSLRAYERDVHLLGGPRTIQTLIDLGAVDKLELLLLPVLFGDGLPFAIDDSPMHDLRLTDTRAYPDGVVGLTYEFK